MSKGHHAHCNQLPSSCCCGSYLPYGGWNRREFLTAAAAGAAPLVSVGWEAAAGEMLGAEPTRQRQQPIRKTLRVQPVFNCHIYERQRQTSWRVTGAIQDAAELHAEEEHIRRDLAAIKAAADFPVEILPLVTVENVEQASAIPKIDHDVTLIYAARRNVAVLEALAGGEQWKLMFVRHRSGPLYYMYIGAHTHFLRKRRDTFAQPNMDIHDVVVDSREELLWRLRALAGLKNMLGKRIVAVGGPAGWGADGKEAPGRAVKNFRFDIQTVSYEELGKRIQRAQQDAAMVRRCAAEADRYLAEPGVRLEVPREDVHKAFLLTEVFRDLLDEAQTDAITINLCMSTIMPVSGTTACLPLGILNDEGYLAFCESDFVVIPAAVLLHYVSGKPVFFCNPSWPHQGMVTVSHCTAPRKMDGRTLEPVRIVTHYESDFGAAPKVDMRKGQEVTVINADFSGRRWLGFSAEIADSPFFPICRTQLELRIRGDWERLLEEIRGFHWLVCYGQWLREMGYAVRKAGLEWLALTPR